MHENPLNIMEVAY